MTTAGQLPYEAIIHAVGPKMGEGDEQRKIQLAISRSLQMCDMHDWKSIAFPAISSGIFAVPIEISAQAFFHAITSFWDARMDTSPEKVIICLTEKKFLPFLHAFRQESLKRDGGPEVKVEEKNIQANNLDDEPEVGIITLSEEDVFSLDNDDVNEWFK